MSTHVDCFHFRDRLYPLLVSHSCLAAGRDLGSPPPGSCPEEVPAQPASSELRGPTALGLALAPLVTMAFGVAYREARNGHRLARQRIPALLVLEEYGCYSWQARRV